MPERTISFDLIPDAVVTADFNGIIRQVNSQLTAMFGYQEHELIGQPIEVLLPERIRERHIGHRAAIHSRPTMRPMGAGLELHGRRKDGSEFPVDIMLSSLDDGRVLALVRDTTTAKNMRARLAQLAYFDSLTGLPNRPALYRALDEFFKADRDGAPGQMSIALFDLDGFKEVNDAMGHSSGDALLKEVAIRWLAVVGKEPRLFRLGGDEFILLVPGCGDPGRIADIVGTMLRQLETPFDIAGTTAFVSACAGIAIAPADGADTEELIGNVDMALYKAKAVGRSQYAFFLNALRADVQARRDLDTKLRRAHSHGEFELHFQPQVRLADGKIVGAEALLRWNQGRSLIAPGAFIEMLAASPISTSVGSWILRSACETAASWRRHGGDAPRVAINLFPSQYYDPSFVAEVEQVLADTGLAPEISRARDHRKHCARRKNGGDRAAAKAARPRGANRARRLRDRLRFVELSHAHAADGHQDRPAIRARTAGRPEDGIDRPFVDRNGPQSRADRGRRGRRDDAADAVPAVGRLRRGAGLLVREAAFCGDIRCAREVPSGA